MTENDTPSIRNCTCGTSTVRGHENGEDLNAQQWEMIALKAKMQVLETENKQLVEEKKIQEDKYSKLKKEMREKSLEKDELAQNIVTLEKYQNEIAELKVKLTSQNELFEEKLKELEEMIQMKEQKISGAENEIMVLIHEMKVRLAAENWHDLLAFVPRSQLGNVVSQIGHRQFANIIQSFLHDPVRKITLGKMRIIPPRPDVSSDLPAVKVGHKAATNIPDWPMPGNVNNFVEIDLKYVDVSVLNFLRKFQENSLMENVNLCIQYNLRKHSELLQVFTQIVPMISSIHSIQIDSLDINLFKMVYNNTNHDNSHQLLLKQMMEKTRIVLTRWRCINESDDNDSWEDKMDWCFTWLYTPTDDGKPRMLRTFDDFQTTTDCDSFIERIKKDFKMANNPISFFIYTSVNWKHNVQDISIDNVKTNEKLVIQMKSNPYWKKLMIWRYPLNADKSWIEANEKAINQCRWKIDRKINIDYELTVAL